MICEEKAKSRQLIVSGSLQFIFLPAMSGFLSAMILISDLLQKLHLNRFSFINFPTIKIQATATSTYTGLMSTAGLGCVLGLMLYQFFKILAKMMHFELIKIIPPEAAAIPSAADFFKLLIRLISVPLIIFLAVVTARDLAKTGMLPGVDIDLEYHLFEVTSLGIAIIAALGCFLGFLFYAGLAIFLKSIKHKEVQIKEIELY